MGKLANILDAVEALREEDIEKESIEEILKIARLIICIAQDKIAKPESAEAANTIIIGNSFLLSIRSLDFLLMSYNEANLQSLRSSPQNGMDLIGDILVATLNIMDFESPSWETIEKEHLYYGIEIIAGRQWILRDFMTLGHKKPLHMNMFPQVAGGVFRGE